MPPGKELIYARVSANGYSSNGITIGSPIGKTTSFVIQRKQQSPGVSKITMKVNGEIGYTIIDRQTKQFNDIEVHVPGPILTSANAYIEELTLINDL
jgi:hypothetical protein